MNPLNLLLIIISYPKLAYLSSCFKKTKLKQVLKTTCSALAFSFVVTLFPGTSYSNQGEVKDKIISYLTHTQKEQLSLLEKLVNMNSGTSNIEGVHKVGEQLIPEFDKLGFKVSWEKLPESMNRANTLIAQHVGTKGKKLLLIGHLDTVFPLRSSFQNAKKINNNLIGPGVIDDKGGVVVILYALKALQAIHALDDANITVVLTGDEEDSGKPTAISRKVLIELAKHSDIALDFEWALSPDTATVARRGISHWEITSNSLQENGHSSAIFQKNIGYGAIFELVRILNTMREELASEHYLTFNPGIILGGSEVKYDKQQGVTFGKNTVIAKQAMAKGDLRFIDEAQKNRTQEKIVNIVNNHLSGTNASVAFQVSIPAMSPSKANEDLLEKYSQASIALGHGPITALDPGRRGAGDISHIASFVSASLAGLGPVGTGAHSEAETLNIPSLNIQSQRAALLIYRLVKEGA